MWYGVAKETKQTTEAIGYNLTMWYGMAKETKQRTEAVRYNLTSVDNDVHVTAAGCLCDPAIQPPDNQTGCDIYRVLLFTDQVSDNGMQYIMDTL